MGPFAKAMNHSSNDVKVTFQPLHSYIKIPIQQVHLQVLVAMMISHLAKSKDTLLPPELLKPVLTCLVNGTMEKNSMVKSCRSVILNFVYLHRHIGCV